MRYLKTKALWFYFLVIFFLLSYGSDVDKQKKFKKERSHFIAGEEVEEIRGSNIVSNHLNQLISCSKSATGTGREPYPREWIAINVLGLLVPKQVGNTDLPLLTFLWLLSSRDATSYLGQYVIVFILFFIRIIEFPGQPGVFYTWNMS